MIKKLYHISDKKLDYIEARIPDNNYTRTGKEESSLPRICCSEKVRSCILSLYGTFYDETVFIHEINIDDKYVVSPSKELVPDVEETQEQWILGIDSISCECIGEIKYYQKSENMLGMQYMPEEIVLYERNELLYR